MAAAAEAQALVPSATVSLSDFFFRGGSLGFGGLALRCGFRPVGGWVLFHFGFVPQHPALTSVLGFRQGSGETGH